jgi:hypothetical protein
MAKFPRVKVKLTGEDGNAFAILGKCKLAAKKAKIPPEQISFFLKEARSGDYNHLLKVCMDWWNCN